MLDRGDGDTGCRGPARSARMSVLHALFRVVWRCQETISILIRVRIHLLQLDKDGFILGVIIN